MREEKVQKHIQPQGRFIGSNLVGNSNLYPNYSHLKSEESLYGKQRPRERAYRWTVEYFVQDTQNEMYAKSRVPIYPTNISNLM